MKRLNKLAFFISAALVLLPLLSLKAARINGLRCEYLINPLGIDVGKPRLNWVIESNHRGERQMAYQVLVASSPELLANDQGDLWNSGKVASDQSIQVEYAGKTLASRERCEWKVRVWDAGGKPSAWSSPAKWIMGILRPEDWTAQWISTEINQDLNLPDHGIPLPGPLDEPYVRRTFALEELPESALVTVNVMGFYELYVNGRKVGDDVMSPALSNYQKRSLYLTYDVKPYLLKGRNCIGLWLGRGWY
jgi:alpha-L-rhamnosidase